MDTSTFKHIMFPDNFEYSSDSNNLPLEFYLDVLPRSKTIYLKLGYFSSSAIRVLAYGFAQFIYNGGVIKIVTNHFLYDSDKALLDADRLTESEINEQLISSLGWLKTTLTSESEQFFNCLKYLIKNNRVEIIPVMLFPNRMSHYKQGVFIDKEEYTIFMDGSCNFTANGLLENGENISVYRSWGDTFEKRKVAEKQQHITNLCDKSNEHYIYLKPEKIIDAMASLGQEKTIANLLSDEKKLLKHSSLKTNLEVINKYETILNDLIIVEENKIKLSVPTWLNYSTGDYSHQGEAIDAWIKNNKHGTLEIATGGGKTLTSLVCATIAFDSEEAGILVIAVPNKPLIKQWAEDVRHFSIRPIDTEGMGTKGIVRTIRRTIKEHEMIPQHSAIVLTHDALKTEEIKSVLSKYKNKIMLIGDEAHNLGSASFVDNPPEFIEFRLALSATPERQYDPEGTLKLFNYFGPVVYEFSLEEAIGNCLVPFKYSAHKVYLNQEESDLWKEYTEKINSLLWSEDKETKKVVEQLQIRRRAISEGAKAKNLAFKNEISTLKSRIHSLAFCTDKGPEQLISINDILRVEGFLFHQITGDETSNKNLMKDVISSYKRGEIEILTSKKVLDEGFNIPPIKTAYFLASSGTMRTWVQRLGRVLRKSDDTGKKIAEIHDFIVFPPENTKEFKALVSNELKRMQWFMTLAMKDRSLDQAISISNELLTIKRLL